MNRIALKVLGLGMALAVAAGDAAAWGTKAQQAITAMALQVIQEEYPTAFRPGKSNYEKDAVRGATDGYAILVGVPLTRDVEVLQAIANQAQLLRAVRAYGPTSYFAYRMGVLSALVADAAMPLGFAWTPEDDALRSRVQADIEANLAHYDFTAKPRTRTLVRDTPRYFTEMRGFDAEDRKLIADDYARGAGYAGMMSRGGQAYFVRATEAVADIWNTVLYPGDVPGLTASTSGPVAQYFVEEIAYLLNEKRNLYQAGEVYKSFERVTQQDPSMYERIGDLYYAYGTPEATDRAVREWQVAHSLGGPDRRRVSEKLSRHFLELAQRYFEDGTKKGANETVLPSALQYADTALGFDRTNGEAAELIKTINVAIEERKERLELVMNIIAQGEKLMSEADSMRVEGDLVNSVNTYRQTKGFFEAVDDEFPDQEAVAKTKMREADNQIGAVMRGVLDRAGDAVTEGDAKKESHQYEAAIQAYTSVPGMLSIIDEELNPTFASEKRQVTQLAEQRIEDAKVAKVRYEQAQAEQAAQQGNRPNQPARPSRPAS